jgi:hypothetical protein
MWRDIIEKQGSSASRLSFLAIIITVCVGFLMGKLPVDNFMLVVSSATAFYFAYKGSDNEKYAGK